MLDHSLSWFGKLPNHAEFISSKHNPNLENIFNSWIISGQNHIGQPLVASNDICNLYAYVFLLNINHEKIYGILLTSKDSKGRHYPFVITHRHPNFEIEIFINQVKDCFEKLDFKFSEHYLGFNEHIFFNNLTEVLNKTLTLSLEQWVEFYPKPMQLTLSASDLTPILYRKLMQRGY